MRHVMKKWQAVAVYVALPLMTLELVAMGALAPRHAPLLAGGLATMSVTCGTTLVQVYRLRKNARAAFSLALVYAMATGSTMLLLADRR